MNEIQVVINKNKDYVRRLEVVTLHMTRKLAYYTVQIL